MGLSEFGNKLYRGEISIDFVGRSKRWYAISAVVLVVAIAGLVFRGLSLGIEFTGGAEFTATSPSVSQQVVQHTRGDVIATGFENAQDPRVTVVGGDRLQVRTGSLTPDESDAVREVVAKRVDVGIDDVTVQVVGPSWGKEITRKALLALGLFLVFVSGYLAIAFEWRMAVGALVALLHDIVATVGIYALTGFDVTPGTTIGFLTILGYSLYDTVVVFDKVRENTRGILGQSQRTYAEAANLAVNQTLVRSINTSVIALLPIASILFIGAGVLGAGTLKDLSLALLVGVAVGTYSSIFIATPLLADLKNRDPQIQALARRVIARRGSGRLVPAAAAAGGTAAAKAVAGGGSGPTATGAAATSASKPAGATRETGQPGERARSAGSDRHQPRRNTRSQRKSRQRGPRR